MHKRVWNAGWLVVSAIVWMAESMAAEPPAELVGDLGDPKRLAIEGAAAFPPAAIVEALRLDLDFLVASHPCAPLALYPETLRKKVLLGYLHAGFPDAQVEATLDRGAGNVRVRVAEGPRYVKGGVEVVGAKALSAEQLVKLLTTPPSAVKGDSGAPAPAQPLETWLRALAGQAGSAQAGAEQDWVVGEPASFDGITQAGFAAKARRIYADAGRLFPKLDVKVVPEKGKPTARLLVEVQDEGPQAVLRDVEVNGAPRHSRGEVIQFLGLKPGMALNRGVIAEAERKLWESARFLSHKVSFDPPADRGGEVVLRIDLKEYQEAPPLSQELSAIDRALLRLRDRLAELPAGDQEIVVTAAVPDASAELVLAPRRGLLARLRNAQGAPVAGNGLPRTPFDYALVLGLKRTELFSLAGQPWALGTRQLGHLWLRLEVCANPQPDDPERPFALSFGLGFTGSADDREGAPLRLHWRFDPVAFVGTERRHNPTCSIQQGVVTVNHGDVRLQLDEATGELRDFTASIPEYGVKLEVRLQRGRFDALHKELMAAAGQVKETSLPRLAVGLAEQLLSASLASQGGTPEQGRRVAELCAQLGARLAACLDDPFPQRELARDKQFDIPWATDRPAGDATAMMMGLALLPFADTLFPRGSWPWTLAHDTACVLCGKGDYTTRSLAALYQSEDTGPVACLATARLLSLANPDMARAFAARGMERLSLAGFRKDYRFLVTGDSGLARIARKMAEALCEAKAEDIEAFAAVLGPDAGGPFRESVRRLRERPRDKSPAEALPAVLDSWWDAFLRDRVRAALLQLAPPPDAPGRP
jgi:hypothetical protein